MVSLSSCDAQSTQQRSENEKLVRPRAPRGLTIERIYEPDLDRQVAALTLLLRAVYAVAEPPKSMTRGDAGTSVAGGTQCAE